MNFLTNILWVTRPNTMIVRKRKWYFIANLGQFLIFYMWKIGWGLEQRTHECCLHLFSLKPYSRPWKHLGPSVLILDPLAAPYPGPSPFVFLMSGPTPTLFSSGLRESRLSPQTLCPFSFSRGLEQRTHESCLHLSHLLCCFSRHRVSHSTLQRQWVEVVGSASYFMHCKDQSVSLQKIQIFIFFHYIFMFHNRVTKTFPALLWTHVKFLPEIKNLHTIAGNIFRSLCLVPHK